MKREALTRWTTDQAAELYGINNWGLGYFDIDDRGRVVVKPRGAESDRQLDIVSMVSTLEAKEISMPILLRFADILNSRVSLLHQSFNKAIEEHGYRGQYRGVYPIKVNQKQQIIEDILTFGSENHHGLEAGSKAELIAAVSTMQDHHGLIICNGYKDAEFVDLALHALQMGLRVFLVVEMPGELSLVLERAKKLKVRPLLGIRVKLASRAGGHWDRSGGDRSKFGLDAPQIIRVVDALRQAKMLDCLELLHYHLGSQLSDIRRVRNALHEACQTYVDLVHDGAAMGTIDIGGGLAVDYDGSSTKSASSCNYGMLEYAADVIDIIMRAADEAEIGHPTIVTESGRATVAHHSVLIFNVLDVREFAPPDVPDTPPGDCNEMIMNLFEARQTITVQNAQERYHDAVYYRDQVRSMFLQGYASLRERALAEGVFWHIIRRIANILPDMKYIPEELQGIDAAIADVYYGNFSLFQSLPDSWAIDHLFPIMPIHRLDEIPTRQAIIADISCDSDGIIDRFIDLHDVRRTLPLHELDDDEYYVGVFLTGAYQETLGDMHNLLGKTNVVHVRMDDDGKVEYVREVPGDTVEDVLADAEYVAENVMSQIRKMAEAQQKKKKISAKEKRAIIDAFDTGMKGYTYFEK